MLALMVKTDKKEHTKCPTATKNESIYFSLFTLYFWLATNKRGANSGAGASPCSLFFIGYFFLPSTTLKTSLANTQAVCEGGEEESWREEE